MSALCQKCQLGKPKRTEVEVFVAIFIHDQLEFHLERSKTDLRKSSDSPSLLS